MVSKKWPLGTALVFLRPLSDLNISAGVGSKPGWRPRARPLDWKWWSARWLRGGCLWLRSLGCRQIHLTCRNFSLGIPEFGLGFELFFLRLYQ